MNLSYDYTSDDAALTVRLDSTLKSSWVDDKSIIKVLVYQKMARKLK